MKRTNLSRRVSLQARNGIKPVTRGKRGARPASGWTQSVFDMHGRVCFVTGEPAVQAHHVLEASALRRELAAKLTRSELVAVLSDPRNGMPVSLRAHQRHDCWQRRIGREDLPASAWPFAAEHGLLWLLDRTYPDTEEQAA